MVQATYAAFRLSCPSSLLTMLLIFSGLPPWATKFIEMVLMLTADHGPAVSGAMNTIVATRAGKDLISSLASGLLTIGSRFGGALDEAASMFSTARDTGLTPREFVDNSRKANKLSKWIFSLLGDVGGQLNVSL